MKSDAKTTRMPMSYRYLFSTMGVWTIVATFVARVTISSSLNDEAPGWT